MYKAFISYSHAADGRLAPALQSALERFAKPWYKIRYFNVFRDEASLSANPHLWSNIQAALQKSEFLIYMASPVSATSKWVQKEVEYWVANKSLDHLLIVLTDGEIVWKEENTTVANNEMKSLPPVLEKAFTEEPFYIDLRRVRSQEDLSLHNPLFKKEVLKLAAPLHGKEPKDLASEEVSAHRKMMGIRNAAITLLAVLFLAASAAAWIANKNKNEALREKKIAQSNYLISEAKGAVESDPPLAMRLAEQAMLLNNDTAIENAALKIYRENDFKDIHNLENYETSEDDNLSVAFSPGGKTILVGAWTIKLTGNLRLLDLEGKLLKEIGNFSFGINAVAFSPDGKTILAGAEDGVARLWNLNGDLINEMKGHKAIINSVAFSRGGDMILTGSSDKTACLWKTDGTLLQVFNDHELPVTSAAFSPGGKAILTGSGDGTARLWHLNGTLVREFKVSQGEVQSVAFSPGGKMILTGSDISGADSEGARLWDLEGNFIREFENRDGNNGCMAFSPDGKTIFIGGSDHSGSLWDLNGTVLKEYRKLHRDVGSASFSPDGKTILIGAGFPCFLDAPMSLADFLASNKIPQLSAAQKKRFRIENSE